MPLDLQPYRNQDGSFDRAFTKLVRHVFDRKPWQSSWVLCSDAPSTGSAACDIPATGAGFGFTTSGRTEGGQAHTILARDVDTLPSRAFLHP